VREAEQKLIAANAYRWQGGVFSSISLTGFLRR